MGDSTNKIDDRIPSSDISSSIEYAGDAIIIGNKEGIIIQSNQKMLELCGLERKDIIGKHISTFFQKTELLEKPLRFDLLNQGIPVLIERRLQKKDGIPLIVEMHSNKTQNGYISIIRDISKRKDDERKLHDFNKLLSFVTKMEKIGIIEYHLDNKELSVNSEMCHILDINTSTDTIQFNDWLNKIHPDDRYRVEESINTVLIEKIALEFVYRIVDNEISLQKTIKASANINTKSNRTIHSLIITSVEITHTNLLKTQLRESERTFSILTETTTAAIFIYREKYLYVNSAFETITGYSKKEAIGMSFWEIIHPDQKEDVKKRGKNRIKGELVPRKYEMKILTKSNEVKYIEFSANQIDYLGKSAALGTAVDITERKRIEEENKNNLIQVEKEKIKAIEGETRFRQYIEQNSAPMLVINIDSKNIIFSNHSAANLYGYSRDELCKMTIIDLHTLEEDEIDLKMKQAMQSPSNKFHFKHKTKNQEIINVEVNASPVITDGKTAMVLIIRNTTDEIIAKTKLVESHETYRNILNSISEMVYIQDKNGRFKFVNETAKRKYGYNKADFIGKTPEFLSAPEKNNLHEISLKVEKAYQGSIEYFEFWGLKKNGEIFPKEVILSPGYYFGEKVIIAVSRDITKQKAITKELVRAKIKAEENDQLKSAFLANMSHEIRTPMNAILGFSELLREDELPRSEQVHFLKIISKSSYHLLSLINDIVDISKIQANQMAIAINTIKLNELLNETFEYFQGQLENANKQDTVKLHFEHGFTNGNDIIQTDATRLSQILHNIIGNCVKFTSSGSIDLKYQLQDDMLVFTIKDTGIGISAKNQEKVFKRFNQANPTISKDYGGTGLGLSIAKACTELLGGNISLESKKHVGTKVQFNIPYIQ